MINSKSVPKSGEGSGLWFLKILTGLLVIIILAIHFTVNHMLGSMAGLLTYEEVVQYYATHLIIPIMEGLFVTIVVTHSLLGLRSIILDMKPSRGTLKLLDIVFVIGGAGFIIYGLWLIVVIVQQGMSV
jgi:succinate dehydrogenase / fumarate reductase membrane anchor subunit